MRTEIGSEFWDILTCDQRNDLFDKYCWYISGRAALRTILQNIKKDYKLNDFTIGLPSYFCSSMIEPVVAEGLDYQFYDTSLARVGLALDYEKAKYCDAILVLDYFGFENSSIDIPKNKIIIRDLTHSIFIKDYDDADYYFGSLRKWCGFLTGGFAFSKNHILSKSNKESRDYASLRKLAMQKKEQYINCLIDDKSYLDIFSNAEELLDSCEVFSANDEDIEIASYIDLERIKRIRRENASYIIDNLNDICLFKNLGENDCPLCVPIIVENRNELRKFLIKNEVYCPVHWPKPIEINTSSSDSLYEKELSLICDQRYSLNDMRRIVKLVKEFYRRLTCLEFTH